LPRRSNMQGVLLTTLVMRALNPVYIPPWDTRTRLPLTWGSSPVFTKSIFQRPPSTCTGQVSGTTGYADRPWRNSATRAQTREASGRAGPGDRGPGSEFSRLESSLEFKGREGAVRRESVQGGGCLEFSRLLDQKLSISNHTWPVAGGFTLGSPVVTPLAHWYATHRGTSCSCVATQHMQRHIFPLLSRE
jgi:hypothetical protein